MKVVQTNAKLWEVPADRAIPPYAYSWNTALEDVDKDIRRVHANAPKIAYFFPHPFLFVRGESTEHKQRYLCNWLMSQSAWIVWVLISNTSPVIPCCWCDFLNTIPMISSTHCQNRFL